MKKILSIVVALVATITVGAQNIAVVSPSNSTKMYRTLQSAIESAEAGSVIYLPGGGFPIADSVKINKKLTIMGVSHRGDTDNADGATIISGNLFFNEGSSGSALLGVYLTSNVYIGSGGSEVNDVLIRYCNVHYVVVDNNKCMGTVINQNYLRSCSYFHGASVEFTNNIAARLEDLDNGKISYNIFHSMEGSNWGYCLKNCNNTSMTNNVFLAWPQYDNNGPGSGSDSYVSSNMAKHLWGDNAIELGDKKWSDIFENPAGVYPNSNYHFKKEFKEYESLCGIYAGGTGFSDKALAPIPRIVSKKVAEQTDGSGKLQIEVTVKAQ